MQNQLISNTWTARFFTIGIRQTFSLFVVLALRRLR